MKKKKLHALLSFYTASSGRIYSMKLILVGGGRRDITLNRTSNEREWHLECERMNKKT